MVKDGSQCRFSELYLSAAFDQLFSITPAIILCGVPQGSVLGPILFLLLICCHRSRVTVFQPHLYADNMQIYGFCPSPASLDLWRHIFACINVDEVASWMCSNRLQLNTTKTEILWNTTDRRVQQLPHYHLWSAPFRSRQTPSSFKSSEYTLTVIPVSMRSHVAKTVVLFCGTASAAEHPSHNVQICPL